MKTIQTSVRETVCGFLPLVFLLCATIGLPAMGGNEKEGSTPIQVTVSGRVRLVGSSPITSLVISGEDREWYIAQPEEKKLMHLQQQTVTVSGKEYYFDYFFADGSSAGRRYFIKDITVIGPAK
jgi:hypothetical protein